MASIKMAAEIMEKIAKDDTHGYSQTARYGPDYDCSSLVAFALSEAGFAVSKYSWTGNLEEQLRACGFVNCSAPWKAGDVHLKPGSHVAMSINESQIAEAAINEKGTISGGQPGDQTGNEIRIRGYYNYPWSVHLRFPAEQPAANKTIEEVAREVLLGKWGNGEARKEALEGAGYDYSQVQSYVNFLCDVRNSEDYQKVARDVIRGVYGNGAERKEALEANGYPYEVIQSLVNQMLNS